MSDLHRTAQAATLASVKTWGIYSELVVQDSPGHKITAFLRLDQIFKDLLTLVPSIFVNFGYDYLQLQFYSALRKGG